MVKRFSDLDKALRYIRTGTGDNAVSVPPVGSPLEQYQKYKRGDLVVSYDRAANSNPGNIISAVINPFGLAADQLSLTTVPFSQRARDNAPGTNLIGACGHEDTLPDPLPEPLARFIPAKATIFVPATGTSTETSQLTGISYQKRNGASYTYPYGKDTTSAFESEVRSDILEALGGNDFAGTVTFKSERF